MFKPYTDAYIEKNDITDSYQNILHSFFSQHPYTYVSYQGIFSVPCKPLVGISVPAFLYDMSIPTKYEYKKWIKPLQESIMTIVSHIYAVKNHEE
jgi:hypothetical protein